MAPAARTIVTARMPIAHPAIFAARAMAGKRRGGRSGSAGAKSFGEPQGAAALSCLSSFCLRSTRGITASSITISRWPGRCHRRRSNPGVRGRDARRADVQQGQIARQRRPVGKPDRSQPRSGCALSLAVHSPANSIPANHRSADADPLAPQPRRPRPRISPSSHRARTARNGDRDKPVKVPPVDRPTSIIGRTASGRCGSEALPWK